MILTTNEDENRIESIVNALFFVIKRLSGWLDIVKVADRSGLGDLVPQYLRQYGECDFTYDYDVRYFLRQAIKRGGKELELFLEMINKYIKKYHCCKYFEYGMCEIPRNNYWRDDFCYKCDKFRDSGLMDKFKEALRMLGYSLDEDGFIVSTQTLDIEKELSKISKEIATDVTERSIIRELVPEDIIEKAKEMAEVYVYLYCVENTLRHFVKIVCSQIYGSDYMKKIKIPKDIQTKIKRRKKDAEKHKWLTIRGDEDLFYLDIEDIGRIIQSNWDIFKEFFPDQNWIVQRIREIQDMRNPVAHNCYIGETERTLLRGYYNTILKQIAKELAKMKK
jgi:hypothetical protein